MKQLNKCRKGAKHLHGIVLFEFFYKMFQRDDADHMYIGVHELCQLVSKSPCPAGKHHMKNRACPAYELLVKYNEWKVRQCAVVRGALACARCGAVRARQP